MAGAGGAVAVKAVAIAPAVRAATPEVAAEDTTRARATTEEDTTGVQDTTDADTTEMQDTTDEDTTGMQDITAGLDTTGRRLTADRPAPVAPQTTSASKT